MSEIKLFKAPVFKMKKDSPLAWLYQQKDQADKAEYDFYQESVQWLTTHGCTKQEGKDFFFYNENTMGWFAGHESRQLMPELDDLVDAKGLRHVKQGTVLEQNILQIYHKYQAQIEGVAKIIVTIYVIERGLYTRPFNGVNDYVQRLQKLDDGYFIGGTDIDFDGKAFKENYEPFDYTSYVELYKKDVMSNVKG